MISSNQLTLRSATPDDETFLRELFASTRIDEFKFLADRSQLDALITMQFNFQRQQYEAQYPNADHSIILCDGQPVGRLYVDESEREIGLVDVALLPEWRGGGIGSSLLKDLLTRATTADKPVRLHVVKSNPARRLYERLGFSVVAEDGMYCEMVWQPANGARKD